MAALPLGLHLPVDFQCLDCLFIAVPCLKTRYQFADHVLIAMFTRILGILIPKPRQYRCYSLPHRTIELLPGFGLQIGFAGCRADRPTCAECGYRRGGDVGRLGEFTQRTGGPGRFATQTAQATQPGQCAATKTATRHIHHKYRLHPGRMLHRFSGSQITADPEQAATTTQAARQPDSHSAQQGGR